MSESVLIGGYVVGFLVTLVPVTRWRYEDEQSSSKRYKDSNATIMFWGLFCAALWPLVWVIALIAAFCSLLAALILPRDR